MGPNYGHRTVFHFINFRVRIGLILKIQTETIFYTPYYKYMNTPLLRLQLCLSRQSLQCFTNRVCKILFPSVQLLGIPLWAYGTQYPPSYVQCILYTLIECALLLHICFSALSVSFGALSLLYCTVVARKYTVGFQNFEKQHMPQWYETTNFVGLDPISTLRTFSHHQSNSFSIFSWRCDHDHYLFLFEISYRKFSTYYYLFDCIQINQCSQWLYHF